MLMDFLDYVLEWNYMVESLSPKPNKIKQNVLKEWKVHCQQWSKENVTTSVTIFK